MGCVRRGRWQFKCKSLVLNGTIKHSFDEVLWISLMSVYNLSYLVFFSKLRMRVSVCHHVPIKPVKLCLVSVPLTNVVSGPLSKLWALKVNPNS